MKIAENPQATPPLPPVKTRQPAHGLALQLTGGVITGMNAVELKECRPPVFLALPPLRPKLRLLPISGGIIIS
ncbi:MAG: hypothetical protein VR64_17245 [Desulfatitalea sp. BRH_c12]|nr:MAG: hypothetical protein VR64_17245 [Desulfatitalea sp. BRH_c12]